MTYDVQFSLEAAAELVRIAGSTGRASTVLRAAEVIRRTLENIPSDAGHFLSEGLYYIDEEPLRAFYVIDNEAATVEITDFRAL